jgi:hypothetical protein
MLVAWRNLLLVLLLSSLTWAAGSAGAQNGKKKNILVVGSLMDGGAGADPLVVSALAQDTAFVNQSVYFEPKLHSDAVVASTFLSPEIDCILIMSSTLSPDVRSVAAINPLNSKVPKPIVVWEGAFTSRDDIPLAETAPPMADWPYRAGNPATLVSSSGYRSGAGLSAASGTTSTRF